MPLTPDMIMGEVRKGLSAVCATCNHWWHGKSVGLDGCGKSCSGPISGDNFPEYEGILPDLVRFCFVCGRDSFYALQVGQKRKRVGVCEAHIHHLNELVPKGGIVQEGRLYAARNGSLIRVERIVRKPNTLVKAIMDQEKAWEEEDRHNAEKMGIDPDTLVEN